MVHELLGKGRECAVTGEVLAQLLGRSARDVSLQVERERKAGIPICASCDATHPGYFLASGPDELAGYLASLDRRLREVRKTRSALQSTLDDMVGQVELDGWDENSLGGG